MNTTEATEKAQEQFHKLSKLPVGIIIGLSKDDAHWVINLEALERKGIPDTMDVLGLYEICLDYDGNLVSFERKRLRKRGQTEPA